MGQKRLLAYPIREGIVSAPEGTEVIWRDYQWNSGEVERAWLVDPKSISEADVTIRPSELKLSDVGPNRATNANDS